MGGACLTGLLSILTGPASQASISHQDACSGDGLNALPAWLNQEVSSISLCPGHQLGAFNVHGICKYSTEEVA